MSSDLTIINLALARIGNDPVSSPTEGTKPARAAKLAYREVVEEVLGECDWWFARAFYTPNTVSGEEDPLDTYEYVYQLPKGTVIVAVRALESGMDFDLRAEGKIWTNDSAPVVRATNLVLDPAKWRPWFRACVVSRLAAELSIILPGREARHQANLTIYQDQLRDADAKNRRESPKAMAHSDSWILARTK